MISLMYRFCFLLYLNIFHLTMGLRTFSLQGPHCSNSPLVPSLFPANVPPSCTHLRLCSVITGAHAPQRACTTEEKGLWEERAFLPSLAGCWQTLCRWTGLRPEILLPQPPDCVLLISLCHHARFHFCLLLLCFCFLPSSSSEMGGDRLSLCSSDQGRLPPHSPECRDFRCEPPCPANVQKMSTWSP